MRLIYKKNISGEDSYEHEIWELSVGYVADLHIRKSICSVTINRAGVKDITREIAKYLGFNPDLASANLQEIKLEKMVIKPGELKVAGLGIDCFPLGYTHPELYKNLLCEIQKIIDQKYRHKSLEEAEMIRAAENYVYNQKIPTLDTQCRIGVRENSRVEVILDGAVLSLERVSRRRKEMCSTPNNKLVRVWVNKYTGVVELIE